MTKRTGGAGSRSRRSTNNETDYDNMDIEEINVLIEETEREIEKTLQEMAKIRRTRTIPPNQKEKHL